MASSALLGPPQLVIHNSPPIKCQVVDWNLLAKPAPVLKILCPPRDIFSPIYVSVELTWEDPTQEDWLRIVARSGDLTEFMGPGKGAYQVKLKRYVDGQRDPIKVWVKFTQCKKVVIQQVKGD